MPAPRPAAVLTVADQVRNGMDQFSSSEKKVARALLAEYPTAGLDTVAYLAERARVSAPTVVRFCRRIGFQGFPELQAALRHELAPGASGPLSRLAATRPSGTASELVRDHAEVRARAVATSLLTVPPSEIDAAVALIGDGSRRVTLGGGRFSHVLAQYFELYLQQLRPKVRLVESSSQRRTSQLLDIDRNDVVVVFDYRRYQRDSILLAQHARRRKASVVLLTDPWLSPAAAYADVVLPTEVESPSAFDALAPAFALVECLVAGVLGSLGDSATTRMRHWDSGAQDRFGLLEAAPAPG
ncbi:MurR/RpiR family transcriptional regulator [Nocardioides aquiterrae]|uniref:MurR/RpiR family transcriptional regulator n=1 Tax=Nocardioides aquiterrae TaxID=203799 RepID=A0ABN1UMI6_9ACTN